MVRTLESSSRDAKSNVIFTIDWIDLARESLYNATVVANIAAPLIQVALKNEPLGWLNMADH